MKGSRSEQQPGIALSLHAGRDAKVVLDTVKCLQGAGLIVDVEVPSSAESKSKPKTNPDKAGGEGDAKQEEKLVFVIINASASRLEQAAEEFDLRKPIVKDLVPGVPEEGEFLRPFTCAKRKSFVNVDSPSFFTVADRQMLLFNTVKHIPISDTLKKELQHMAGDQSLIFALDRADLLKGIVASQDHDTNRSVFNACMKRIFTDPVHEIRSYYGSETAFYFAWMQFFTLWLIPLGALGFLLWYIRPAGVTVDKSALLPFYGLFVVLYSQVFVKGWSRLSNSYSYVWGCSEFLQDEDIRGDFHGELAISRITGKPELYYAPYKRWLSYCFSAIVTGAALVVAFCVMVCSFNLQGYMSDVESPFHVPVIHQFSNPGAIFDPNGNPIIALIPVVLHSFGILMLNMLYRSIAEWLTEIENHRTESEHESAVVLKRFLFEAFDCYIPLFYLAFWELDADLLRAELVALFTTDSVRRVATETLLPYFTWSGTHKKAESANAALVDEDSKEDYEIFDDYLEMVIQYGYIIMFASAFPLASALSIVCNLIEVRSDAFKISFIHRKPIPRRTKSIGIWHKIIVFQTWLAIATNCAIFAFSSEQMGTWFPWLFTAVESPSNTVEYEAGNLVHAATETFKQGYGRYAVGIVVGIEHILILLSIAIHFMVPDVPKWVSDMKSRELYSAAKKA